MRYFALRVVRILKPEDKELISIVPPSEKFAIISAIGPDGVQQLYELAANVEVDPDDVILIDSYQKFPNVIEYRISKVVKGQAGQELLRIIPYVPEKTTAADNSYR